MFLGKNIGLHVQINNYVTIGIIILNYVLDIKSNQKFKATLSIYMFL